MWKRNEASELHVGSVNDKDIEEWFGEHVYILDQKFPPLLK
jgi:hypothetical protein